MTFNINENSFCISVDDSRYSFLCNRFSRVGLSSPELFYGFKAAGGCLNYVRANTLSHIGVLETARQRRLPYVTVFEDDAYPRSDIHDILYSSVDELSSVECDLLYLGRNGDASLWNDEIEKLHTMDSSFRDSMSSVTRISDHLCRVSRNVFGTHAFVVFKSGYDKLLAALLTGLAVSDRCYADMLLSQYGCICFTSQLFVQYNKDSGSVIHVKDIDTGNGYIGKSMLSDLGPVWR